MYALVFDTETTGLPKNRNAPMTDLDNWPRIIEIAYEVIDVESGSIAEQKQFLIEPDGWTIPEDKFWIDNGFNTQKSKDEGIPLPVVFEKWFIPAIDECDIMVAHNIAYDYPVVGAEMIRYDCKANKRLPKYCTMQSSINLLKIPGKFGNYKWTSLAELHQYLFNTGFDEAHHAGVDVRVTAKCFIELVRRNVINPLNKSK